MAEFIRFIPIIIMTLAMIIVSFLPIKKENKKIAVITTFMLWLATFGITWVALLK